MHLKIKYFASFFSVSMALLAVAATPRAQAANIITFDTNAPTCAETLVCGADSQAPAFNPTAKGAILLQPPVEQFAAELSDMRWTGCLQGRTCGSGATGSLLNPYGAIAAGANFDISVSSANAANYALRMDRLPEPASIALLGSMLFGLGFIFWRKLTSSP